MDLTSNNCHLIARLPLPTFWILILLIFLFLKWKGFLYQMRVINNIGLFPYYSIYFIYFVFFVLKKKSSIICHAIFWIPFFRGKLISYIFWIPFFRGKLISYIVDVDIYDHLTLLILRLWKFLTKTRGKSVELFVYKIIIISLQNVLHLALQTSCRRYKNGLEGGIGRSQIGCLK